MKSLNELIWNSEDFNDDGEITINDTHYPMVALCGGSPSGCGCGCLLIVTN